MSYKRRNIIRALREYDFDLAREGSNHTIFSDGRVSVPVPRHRQIASKTAMRIAKQIGVNWQQFKSKISYLVGKYYEKVYN